LSLKSLKCAVYVIMSESHQVEDLGTVLYYYWKTISPNSTNGVDFANFDMA